MRRILIVDDNIINRQLLRKILQRDYELVEVENGREALALLQSPGAGISAVLLDIMMPVMDGYELLKIMRADAALARIPVIVSTGSEGEEAELKALSLGATDFIPKPFRAAVILRRIDNLLRLVDASSSVEKLGAEKEALRISEEQYRIAASAGGRITARYDIRTGTYFRRNEPLTTPGIPKAVANVPQAFIERGLIAPECYAEYFAFFERLKSGADSSHADISICISSGVYRWYHFDATVIFSDEGDPSQAIIVYTDITDQREKEAVYKKWQQTLQQKDAKSFTLFRCNLSHNESFETMEGVLLKGHAQGREMPFNMQSQEYALQYVHPDDREYYLSVVTSDALLANYYRNRRIETIEYRELLPSDKVRWLRLTIELVEYPKSSDIEAYLMFEDINDKKLAELKTKEQAERDPLTGVFNRAAFSERVERILERANGTEHALLMLDVDRFKQLNDVFGHAAGDQELIDIAAALHSTLRSEDLVGRLGGDEFVMLMRDVPYDGVIAKKALQICALIRKTFSTEVRISASIGIAVFPRDGGSFDALYRCADTALYSVKESGKDNFAFYDQQAHAQTLTPRAPETDATAEKPQPARSKRRMLIVDDNELNRGMLANMFKDDYIIETASDGNSAMVRLRHYGASVSVVLLDLLMPGMDGFTVLDKMHENLETRTIPVIVVSGQNDRAVILRAIRQGATDYVTKPVDPELLRLRVESAVSKSESERLRAQNSYLLLQSSEEAKYRTVLDSTGTVVIEFDWMGGVFTYDDSISQYIAGKYDDRRLWQILLSDMVADTADVQAMQELVRSIADDRRRDNGGMKLRLKTPSGKKQWFRMRIFKQSDEYRLTNKLIITFINVNDEVIAEEKLHFQAERDELTGLWNRKTFFEKAAAMIAARKSGYYIVACFDIDNFKVINDQYGSDKGDEVLVRVADVLRTGFEAAGGIVCRITADNFAVLYPAGLHADKLRKIREDARVLDGSIPPISFRIGRYIADDETLSVSAMYDRATLAQSAVKGRFDVNIGQYDESMRERLLQLQTVVNEMDSALAKRQFEVWFQPQYNHATGARIGAEALVRWRHPLRGIIPPDDFIPIFERNGFIYELDRYIWERTCAYIAEWTQAGLSPLPVSVNISRYDLFRSDLCDTVVGLVKKYGIAPSMLRLEITESAFASNTEQLVAVVKRFIDCGFTIEIDDFGSGYSSLNTLKDVPAQVLKMDMHFLSSSDNSDRGGNILESVVRMAKWLGMAVIAEGVETKAQADYLKSIGCSYVQGYLYASPMPVDEYLRHINRDSREEQLLALETVENYDNNSFWNPESMDTLIFNSYVGGACIFEWNGRRIEILRANDKYAKVIGGENCSLNDALHLVWEEHMDEASALATRNAIERAIATGEDASYEAVYHDLFGSGEDTWLRTTFRVVARAAGSFLLYATNINLTQQHRTERKMLDALEQLQNMIDDMPGGYARLRVLPDGELATEYVNESFCRIRGMTRDEILVADSKGALATIHPDDIELVRMSVAEMIASGETRCIRHRIRHGDGHYVPLNVSGRATRNEAGDVVLNVYYEDVTEREKSDPPFI